MATCSSPETDGVLLTKTPEHTMGFDTSYKSAATNSVTWATMDPKRDDGKAYSIAYVAA